MCCLGECYAAKESDGKTTAWRVEGRWGRVSPARGAREERVGEKPGARKAVLAGAQRMAGSQRRAPFLMFAGVQTP